MAEGGSSGPPEFRLETSTNTLPHKLHQARQQGHFSDFQIVVNGVAIPCHKLILSVQSEYFSCMLRHEDTVEVKRGYVDLQELDVDAVKHVVDFMYSGIIECNFQTAQEVIRVIDRFQLSERILQEKLSEYVILHLCPDNCLGWFKFAEQMNLKQVKTEAQLIMVQKFDDVCKSSEFVNITFEEITDYMQKVIQSHYNHDQCLKAFVTWTMSDTTKRSDRFEEILKIIDLNKCSSNLLKEIYQNHGKVLLHNFDLLERFTAALSLGITEPKASFSVIVAGGCVDVKVNNRQTWLLNIASGSCVEKASQTKDQYKPAVCASPDGLICTGGTLTGRNKDPLTDCVLYHKNTDTWVDLPPLQFPTCCAGAICLQDALLMIVGGRDDRKDKAVMLDLRTRTWTICDDMLQGLVFPIVGSIDDCVFVIYPNSQEYTRIGKEKTVQCYNTTTRSWTFKSPLPDSIKRTCGARAIAISGQLYLVGGSGPICAKYDPKCDKWTVLTPSQHPYMYGAALGMNGKIILSGGRTNDGKAQDSIQEYDPAIDSWRLLPVKLPKPLYDHCMILG